MKAIKIGIVEDEAIIAHNIVSLLKDLGYNTCEPCSGFYEAIGMINTEQPDFLLLDIQLANGPDGIKLAEFVRHNYNIPYVFLTANSDKNTLEQAKQTRPYGFIVKPFQKQDLFAAIEIAMYNHKNETQKVTGLPEREAKDGNILFIKEGQYFHKVYINDILYISSDHVYVTVHTSEKRFLVRATMQEYLNKLDANTFLRIHRSYAVNINKIEKINSVYLIVNGEQLPVSRNHRETLMEAVNV